MHVRSHQRAIGVVILEERDQGGGHRNQLFRRDVDILDVFAQGENEFAGLSSSVALVDDIARLIEYDVGLTDNVLILFPCGQVKRPWLGFSPATIAGKFLVGLLNFLLRDVLTRLGFPQEWT